MTASIGYVIPFDDIADADDVLITYDAPLLGNTRPPHRIARGSTAPCVIPSIVEGTGRAVHPGNPALPSTSLQALDDLSPRTITAELTHETPDYDHLEAIFEWEAC